MSKGLHKVFHSDANELNNALHDLGELVSDVSHIIPEPSNFS